MVKTNIRNPFFILILLVITTCVFTKSYYEDNSCDIGALKKEIEGYSSVVQEIINYTVSGAFKGKTYDELAKFVDTVGQRPSGTQNLEDAIDYMINLTRNEGLSDITTESLKVPRWERLEENVTMLEPRIKNIAVLGLGYSVSTPPEGITAEVLVVPDFATLEKIPINKVKGKIVLFNAIFTNYSQTIIYRLNGATKAAQKGAIVALIRTIAPFSINSPHTGAMEYDKKVTKIPTAAITLEDADLIQRITDRGIKVVLHIKLLSKLTTASSRNTLIDLKGRQNPEKLVIVSGHIDSWDVGQGAMDDGGGMFISWAAPVILKRLNLKPRRTVRAILWTAEELGLIGAFKYEEKHRNEGKNINFIMESDEGTFAPLGLAVGGTNQTRCIVAAILQLFKTINASTLIEDDAPGTDIVVFTGKHIPGASLVNDDKKYFWFHHSEGDTMNVENPYELDLGAAFWTAVAYIIADLSVDMPR